MNFPEELKYTKEHEWIRIVDNNIAYIGITDFAQRELGDIVFVEAEVGKIVKMGEIFGTVEAVKTVSDLFMPVSGEILELNEMVNSVPELINTDPYDTGHIVKIKLTNPEEIDTLLSSNEYKKIIGIV